MKVKILINFLIAFLSLLLFFGFLWFRFVRERLPKNIPIDLSTMGFIIITFICVMYAIGILLILLGKTTNNFVPDSTLLLYKPFEYFTEIKGIQPYFSKYLLKFTTYLEKKNMQNLYIIFELIPRTLLVIFFAIDVFYFKNIWTFYTILPIGLLIFIAKFIKYCIQFILQKNISIINERADIHCFNFKTEEGSSLISTKDFIKEQAYRKLNSLSLVEYAVFFNIQYVKSLRVRLNIPNNLGIDTEKFKKRIVSGINLALALYILILKYTQQQLRFKYLTLCILVLYLISWTYILYVSFPSLNLITFIELLPQNSEEPFSGLTL